MDPLQAARAVMFAKASSMVGAIVSGVYAGYGVFLLGHLDIDVYRSRAVVCGITVLAGIALVAAALFLEYVLRVPPAARRTGCRRTGTRPPPRHAPAPARSATVPRARSRSGAPEQAGFGAPVRPGRAGDPGGMPDLLGIARS
ncbi:DUF3180 domain-containing protein [Catenulispora yoronensis]